MSKYFSFFTRLNLAQNSDKINSSDKFSATVNVSTSEALTLPIFSASHFWQVGTNEWVMNVPIKAQILKYSQLICTLTYITTRYTHGKNWKYKQTYTCGSMLAGMLGACEFLPPKLDHTETTLKTRVIYKTNDYFIQAIVYLQSLLVCVLLCLVGDLVIKHCL